MNNSERKKLKDYEEEVMQSEMRSGFLDRKSSHQHSRLLEETIKDVMKRQQSQRSIVKQSSALNFSTRNKTPKSNQPKFQRIDFTSQLKGTKQQNENNQNAMNISTMVVPQFLGDTDEGRSARQNLITQELSKKPFKFSFRSYVIQLIIAYGLTFAIMYLTKVGSFPYYEIIFIIALTASIQPWKISNVLLFCAIAITVCNNYMGLSSLTYFQILACYISVLSFNQKHKIKILFIVTLGIILLTGFLILPKLYIGIKNQVLYYYIFPIIMFLLRSITQILYWITGYSTNLYLQIPLFIAGIQYGTILSVSIGEIEFWYLMVFFTLQIMNQRTQFCLKIMVKMVLYCMPNLKPNQNNNNGQTTSAKFNNHILPAHFNGFNCVHSFHIVCMVYIVANLKLYASPYSSTLTLQSYTVQAYKPIIVWALSSVYQLMCLILQRNRKDVLLYGYTSNKWYQSILRGVILVIGLWMFYMGLGVGQYVIINGKI